MKARKLASKAASAIRGLVAPSDAAAATISNTQAVNQAAAILLDTSWLMAGRVTVPTRNEAFAISTPDSKVGQMFPLQIRQGTRASSNRSGFRKVSRIEDRNGKPITGWKRWSPELLQVVLRANAWFVLERAHANTMAANAANAAGVVHEKDDGGAGSEVDP